MLRRRVKAEGRDATHNLHIYAHPIGMAAVQACPGCVAGPSSSSESSSTSLSNGEGARLHLSILIIGQHHGSK